jgi:hypothetical protein
MIEDIPVSSGREKTGGNNLTMQAIVTNDSCYDGLDKKAFAVKFTHPGPKQMSKQVRGSKRAKENQFV